MEFEDKITIAKRISNLYKLVIGLTPVIFTVFYFAINELSERLYNKEIGNIEEDKVRNETGFIIILIPILFVFSVPFFIWAHNLRKTIKDNLTPNQIIQLIILGLFPVSVYLFFDIQFVLAIINHINRLYS